MDNLCSTNNSVAVRSSDILHHGRTDSHSAGNRNNCHTGKRHTRPEGSLVGVKGWWRKNRSQGAACPRHDQSFKIKLDAVIKAFK